MIKIKSLKFPLLIILVSLVLVIGCTSASSPTQPQQVVEIADNSVTAPASLTVEITPQGFNPKMLTIKQGETVTFVNKDTNLHWPASAVHPTHAVYDGTSLSEHCPNPESTSFDACHGLEPGETFSFRFDKVGSWNYHDHFNPASTGTINVK